MATNSLSSGGGSIGFDVHGSAKQDNGNLKHGIALVAGFGRDSFTPAGQLQSQGNPNVSKRDSLNSRRTRVFMMMETIPGTQTQKFVS